MEHLEEKKSLHKRTLRRHAKGQKGSPSAHQSATFGVHSVEGMIRDQERLVRINQRLATMSVGKTEGPGIRFPLSPVHCGKEYRQDDAKNACALKYAVGD